MSTATYWYVKIVVLDWMDKVFGERDDVEFEEIIQYVKKMRSGEVVDWEAPAAMWTDGERILVSDEDVCEAMHDWIIVHGFLNGEPIDGSTASGYYDPFEDVRGRCVDEYTGWYYIEIQ